MDWTNWDDLGDKMKDCLLTIVMPSCNIQDYILKVLESFQQVFPNYKDKFEVLVVMDGQ